MALKVYVDSGWKVEILLWVVGARNMVRVDLPVLTPALEFLEIPKKKWTSIKDSEATGRASVEELAYMNRIRFSASSQSSTMIRMTRNRHVLLMKST